MLRICTAGMQIPKQVINYTANSKAVDQPGGGYQLMLGTRAFKLDRMLLSRLQRWEVSRGGIQEWRNSCGKDCEAVGKVAKAATAKWKAKKAASESPPSSLWAPSSASKDDDPGEVVKKYLRDEGPSFLISNLASGNTLVASNDFKAKLKSLDRKMTACKPPPSPPPGACYRGQVDCPTPSTHCHVDRCCCVLL